MQACTEDIYVNELNVDERRDVRIQAYVTQDISEKVTQYHKKNHYPSTSAAITAILEKFFKKE
jgi:hypothetical protein